MGYYKLDNLKEHLHCLNNFLAFKTLNKLKGTFINDVTQRGGVL